jgi:hypothetical protein
LKGQIQEFIDVYLSKATFDEVRRCFPYMVSKDFASGGGDVREPHLPLFHLPYSSSLQIPEFKWHIFEDDVPIDVADSGILITPFEGGTACYLTGFLGLGSDTECSPTWAYMVNEAPACVCSYTGHVAIDANAPLFAENQPFVPSSDTTVTGCITASNASEF